jgi:hypothetical protein
MASLIAKRPQSLETRYLVARAVPSSSVSFASIRATGLNSSGMMKSGAWSKPVMRSARFVSRKLTLAAVRTSLTAASTISPTSSLTESRCDANGLPRKRSNNRTGYGSPRSANPLAVNGNVYLAFPLKSHFEWRCAVALRLRVLLNNVDPATRAYGQCVPVAQP